jgi:choline dehydrogenase-like flavoprotein
MKMTGSDDPCARPRAIEGRAPDVLRVGGWIPMRQYSNNTEVDFAIVGIGAGGGTLACRLAEPQSAKRGLWGPRLLEEMQKYNHQVGLKIVGECLPQERNRVSLTDERDGYGLPIPRVTFSFCDNDQRLIRYALAFMRQGLEVVEATEIWDETDDTCHLNGTARMGDDPNSSVVNADCRSWDIPNLWICDGSVFPTVGGVNPSLTIQAIACRTAGRIKQLAARGEL